MRVILVPVADRPECATALTTALDLGRRLDADVIGAHIRPHRKSKVSLPSMAFGDSEWDAAMRGRDSEKMSRSAKEMFARVAGEFDYPLASKARADGTRVAIWQQRVGSPRKLFPIAGPVSDLIVISRPARSGGKLATLFLMRALFDSSRPVLILPQSKFKAPGKHIAIAWDQSPIASQTLAMTLPMIRAADKVSIITVGEERGLGPKASHLERYLRHHGVEATLIRRSGRNVAKELIAAYRKCGADVMVAGASSRSRLAEMIFGGVTQYLLHEAAIPVLMYHG